jgi:hypothetical protein
VTTLRVMITKRFWISRQKHKWIINIVDLWLRMCYTARFGWNLPKDGGKFFHAFLWLIACLDSMQTFLKTIVVQTMEAVLTKNLRLADCQIGSHPLTSIRKVLSMNLFILNGCSSMHSLCKAWIWIATTSASNSSLKP